MMMMMTTTSNKDVDGRVVRSSSHLHLAFYGVFQHFIRTDPSHSRPLFVYPFIGSLVFFTQKHTRLITSRTSHVVHVVSVASDGAVQVGSVRGQIAGRGLNSKLVHPELGDAMLASELLEGLHGALETLDIIAVPVEAHDVDATRGQTLEESRHVIAVGIGHAGGADFGAGFLDRLHDGFEVADGLADIDARATDRGAHVRFVVKQAGLGARTVGGDGRCHAVLLSPKLWHELKGWVVHAGSLAPIATPCEPFDLGGLSRSVVRNTLGSTGGRSTGV